MKTKPTLCFVGPMLGHLPNHVKTQGQILAELFEREGHPIILCSKIKNRYLRFLDTLTGLIKNRKNIYIVCIQIYSGKSIFVEDAASYLAKKLGFRIIMHFHGGDIPNVAVKYSNWLRRICARADVLVTPTDFLKRPLRDLGFKPEIIPNLIEIDSYPFRLRSPAEPKFFWMRAYHEIYNPFMAVKTFEKILQSYPMAKLTMAGPDLGRFEETKKMVKMLKLSESIRLLPRLNDEEKIKEASAHDIYLNTNRVDNMPVSVIEMSALGLPVVSTQVGGVGDFITPWETGMLVPDDDSSEMAEAVIKILRWPKLARRLSANGRLMAEKYSQERVIAAWKKTFSELEVK